MGSKSSNKSLMMKWKMMSNSKVPTLKAMGFVMPKAIGQGTYSSNKIRKTQNEHLIIVFQNLIDL